MVIARQRAQQYRADAKDLGKELRRKSAKKEGNLYRYKIPTKVSSLLKEMWRVRWEERRRGMAAATWTDE